MTETEADRSLYGEVAWETFKGALRDGFSKRDLGRGVGRDFNDWFVEHQDCLYPEDLFFWKTVLWFFS